MIILSIFMYLNDHRYDNFNNLWYHLFVLLLCIYHTIYITNLLHLIYNQHQGVRRLLMLLMWLRYDKLRKWLFMFKRVDPFIVRHCCVWGIVVVTVDDNDDDDDCSDNCIYLMKECHERILNSTHFKASYDLSRRHIMDIDTLWILTPYHGYSTSSCYQRYI